MADKTTDQIRMIATGVAERQLQVCTAHRARIEDRVKRNAERLDDMDPTEVLKDLSVAVGEIKTQIKITWALLFLVVSGLVSVALSILRGP